MRVALPAVLFLTIGPSDRLTAQDLPRSLQRYWQQDIRYTIRASLDEPSGVLTGSATLVYRNNSPDTLRQIFFHQYLNAFRPHSLWSHDERREHIDRFAELRDPLHAYERLGRVAISGVEVVASYPGAPDSTVVRFELPRPLLPRDSLVVTLDWTARLSTVPRRQGRQGRRFDFAQWYPKVAVYDRGGWQAHPLRLAGEFYGEFGSYDVTLDLPDDQVVAATGLPIAGDPGWAGARATPETPVTLQADYYGARRQEAEGEGRQWVVGERRKVVRFYAENIHHFAFTMNPEYRYEEGRFNNIVLRALYLPEDSATWGGGRVIERTARAMAWLDTLFGAYPWPQVIVAHRIEGGGTEFPMMAMNGGPGESLIFHEIGHLYTYGILANNEWKEAWLDEGFTTFQTAWNFQRRGMGTPSTQVQLRILAEFDLDARAEPIGMSADRFSEFGIYNRMVYTKAQLFFEMLRYTVGEDAFRRGLRLYYDRWKLKHVDEAAFREAMESASGVPLGGLFQQWLHDEPLVDYEIRRVVRLRGTEGSWVTRVTVERRGDGVLPVDVAFPLGDSVAVRRLDGQGREETVELETAVKPGRVELDPYRETLDWNATNNAERRRWPSLYPRTQSPGPERRLGWSGSAPARRDRMVHNGMPLAWYSDQGGVTVGIQERTNYLGLLNRTAIQLAFAEREDFPSSLMGHLAIRNPIWLQSARTEWAAEAWGMDGRYMIKASATQDHSKHLTYGPRFMLGSQVQYMRVYDSAFVDPRLWENRFSIEANVWGSLRWTGNDVNSSLRASGSAGLSGRRPTEGSTPNYTSSANLTYLRLALEFTHRRRMGRLGIGVRTLAATVPHFSVNKAPRQRLLYVAGADPYETYDNPFLRSEGALFVRPDVNYSSPGGGGLRGFAPTVSAERMLALNGEMTFAMLRRPSWRIFRQFDIAVFADGAWLAGGDTAQVLADNFLSDAGFGLRAAHRVGPTNFVTRVDFPVFVSVPGSAVSARAGDEKTRFRFVWSLEEAF